MAIICMQSRLVILRQINRDMFVDLVIHIAVLYSGI